jgi:hypothetical protein
MGMGSAFSAFFGILFNKEKSDLWQQANSGGLVSNSVIDKYKAEAQTAKDETEKDMLEKKAAGESLVKLEEEIKSLKGELNKPSNGEEAIYTLTLLQREGRLIDFLKEDVSTFEDAQIGAAVRQVHAGCKKVLDKHFDIVPVVNSTEGEKVTIEKGFDPGLYELSGNVSGEAPYTGELRHKGWKTEKVDLPIRQKGRNESVIYPAEVDI